MTNKKVHIVFQVLNFLHSNESSSFLLLPNECRLLINFASHKGIKGIYPSVPTLMRELKLSRSQILRLIKSLERKNLITTERNIGKSNHYYLSNILSTSVTHDTGVTDDTGVTHDTTPVSPMTRVPVSPMTPDITKVNNKRNKRERAQKSAPISPDFFPDEKTTDYIEKKLRIADDFIADIGEAFIDYFLDSGESRKDWQHECRKWFKREVEMRGNQILSKNKSSEPVYETQKKPEDRAMTDEDRQRNKEAMAIIMAGLKGNGGKLNGLLGKNGRNESVDKEGT